MRLALGSICRVDPRLYPQGESAAREEVVSALSSPPGKYRVPLALLPKPLPAIHEPSQFSPSKHEFSPMRERRKRWHSREPHVSALSGTRGEFFGSQSSGAAECKEKEACPMPTTATNGLVDHRYDVLWTGPLRLDRHWPAELGVSSHETSELPGLLDACEHELHLAMWFLPGPDAWLAACVGIVQAGIQLNEHIDSKRRDLVVTSAVVLGVASLLDQGSLQLMR